MKNTTTIAIAMIAMMLLCAVPERAHAATLAMPSTAEPDTIAPGFGFGNRQFQIDEVLVLSQPKETRLLREQPVSATSFVQPAIDNLGEGSLPTLSLFTPSLAMPRYGSRLTSSVYIRGVGARTGYSPVAMYVDGMPIVNRTAHNMHLYEVQRLDVLRGPQSTLYGQNAAAGLLRVFTQSPLYRKGTFINLSAANGRQLLGEVAHYGKLGEKVGIGVAMFTRMQRGFFKNTNLHQYNDSASEAGGRLRLTWQPTHNFTFDYIADYQYDHERAFPYGLVAEPGGFAELPATTFMNRYQRHMLRTGINMAWQLPGVHLFSTTSYQYLRDRMLMDQDYVAADYFRLGQKQLHHALTQELVARSPLAVGDDTRRYRWLVGLYGAYQWLKTDAPVGFGDAITSPISTGVRNAMYGAILQQMKQGFLARGMSDEQATLAAQQLIEQRGGISMNTTMDTPGQFRSPEYNVALYHESHLQLAPWLLLTAGLRYDYSHQALRYTTQSAMAMTANVMGAEATNTLTSALSNRVSNHAHQLLPKVALTFTLDPQRNNNIYLQVSKGYRSGGFNLQMFSDVLRKELNDNTQQAMQGSYAVPHSADDYRAIHRTITYKPETSWNYEVGTHYNIPLFAADGSMLRIDASVFSMQVRNQQLSIFAGNYGYGRRMVNAGRSHSCGLELALNASMLGNRLQWMLNYSFNHATFREYKDVISTPDGERAVDYRGNHVPFAPEHMLAAAVDYRHELSDNYFVKALFAGVNTHMQGKTWWNETNTQHEKLYALLGARVGADFGFASLSFWARNLTGTRYHTFLVESNATGQMLSFAQRGMPRQFGVDLRFHF